MPSQSARRTPVSDIQQPDPTWTRIGYKIRRIRSMSAACKTSEVTYEEFRVFSMITDDFRLLSAVIIYRPDAFLK